MVSGTGRLPRWRLGIHIASYAGKFEAGRIFEALAEFQITNMAAAPTVFRLFKNSGRTTAIASISRKFLIPVSRWIRHVTYIERAFGVTPAVCTDDRGRRADRQFPRPAGVHGQARGPLAKQPQAGKWRLSTALVRSCHPIRAATSPSSARANGFYVKDRGYCDEAGYFYHEGRSDDVIISAGWTMSAVEIEQTLLKHPSVVEAAVVGVPDPLRGQIAKAYIVARDPTTETTAHIQAFIKAQLSQHEYPRQIEFLDALPGHRLGRSTAEPYERKILHLTLLQRGDKRHADGVYRSTLPLPLALGTAACLSARAHAKVMGIPSSHAKYPLGSERCPCAGISPGRAYRRESGHDLRGKQLHGPHDLVVRDLAQVEGTVK